MTGRSLVVFAGGRATRLDGVNKALLSVGGQPIIQRVLDEVGPLADDWLALVNDDALVSLPGLRLLFDRSPHAGVLAALAQAMEAATGDLCLAIACDMPFASAAVFRYLLRLQKRHNLDVVIPRSDGFLQPMHAVYRRRPVLGAIQAALGRGAVQMSSYFADVRVLEVAQAELAPCDPDGRAFLNVNTAADLEEARRLASSRPTDSD